MKNPAHHFMIAFGGIMWAVSGQQSPGAYILALGVMGMIWSLIVK